MALPAEGDEKRTGVGGGKKQNGIAPSIHVLCMHPSSSTYLPNLQNLVLQKAEEKHPRIIIEKLTRNSAFYNAHPSQWFQELARRLHFPRLL